ncbi:MAG: carboxypeptidase-like regulatory domain-containing protein [Saprospiraceae bacterium]
MRTLLVPALFSILALLPSFLFAQRTITISGKLLSAKDDTPVIFANLYIPNTSYGTYSDDQGNFTFQAQVWEAFELVISHVEHDITLLKLNVSSDEVNVQTIRLQPKAYNLQEVVVKEDKNWKAYYELFRKSFIGTTPNSRQCEITNRLVLNFDYDSTTHILTAWAYEPLKIRNKALGYELTYDLVSFEMDNSRGAVFYQGFPFFKSMEASNKRRTNRWDRERQEAYRGSILHFVRALYRGEAAKEGFSITAQVRQEQATGGMRTVRTIEQVVSPETLVSPDSIAPALRFQTPHRLRLQYNGEKESGVFAQERSLNFGGSAQAAKFQTSFIKLNTEFVRIYSDGYVDNGLDMLLEGYFGWEKIADMLPLDYKE